MEDTEATTLANREEPVPSVIVESNSTSSSHLESRKSIIVESRSSFPWVKYKAKLTPGHSLQDHLLTNLLHKVLPAEDAGEESETQSKAWRHSRRPRFSIPLMTTNFRRFNARIGIVFVFENRLIRLLTWKTPSHTLSLLAVVTFICLDPHLLALVPFILTLVFIMVPAFLIRHPPPASATSHALSYSISGPPLAPPRSIKPASDTSKDFFRNMRDLQNSMDDFSVIHDLVLNAITPLTNFSNEPLSSFLFSSLFTGSCILFISSHRIPWRFLALFSSWIVIALGHPRTQQHLQTNRKKHIFPYEQSAQNWLNSWISKDIVLDAPAETREVEIFELQRRTGGHNSEWEPWIFSPTPYDPLSPQRLSGDRAKGTRFFEDVEAPNGWEWADKKWILDLNSKEWVEDRMIQSVKIEMESERWVIDLSSERLESASEGAASMKEEAKQDWEIGSQLKPITEWRRRRWIRMVKRRFVGDQMSTVS